MKAFFYSYLLIGVLFLSSCASSYHSTPSVISTDYSANKAGEFASFKKAESDLEEVQFDRKIIKNANIELKVLDPDSILSDLNTIAQLNEGYVSQSSDSYAALTVNAENLEETLEMISKLGKVKHQHIHTRDVTAAHTDLKVRLDNAEKSRKRYLELLKKAERVDEILPIEKELERITLTIERMKGQMRVMEHQLAYSKIDVTWQKKTKPGPLGYVFVGIYKAVKVLFVRS